MTTRLSVALALLGVLLASGSAGASQPAPAPGAAARAVALRIVVPGQTSAEQVSVSAPPDAVSSASGFAYPADGSAVTAGSLTGSAATDAGETATATASAEVASLSLFGGEITAARVYAKSRGAASGRSASGDLSEAAVSGLTVLGQPVSGGRVALADWGYALVLARSAVPGSTAGARTWHGFVTALSIHLTAEHAGLPAGTEIQVGYAEASVQAVPSARTLPKPPGAGTTKTRKAKAKKRLKAPEPKPGRKRPAQGPVLPLPAGLHPKLTAGGYVFPVYGPSSFSDDFGAPRADVSYHHGNDIFAPLGAPILACADGTVFSVGWNEIGGNRLWLVDGEGNQFYYAHLSAYSPLAVNGKRVRAGEVLGFVGNTGDAEGTPYHLHFEVHPYEYLFLGYDGAVDPYPYLVAWKVLQDVQFAAVAGWAPSVGRSASAPRPGAILLQASDISEGSGLEPGSLERAMVAPASSEGDAALLRSAALTAG